jgi:hypothetical protein
VHDLTRWTAIVAAGGGFLLGDAVFSLGAGDDAVFGIPARLAVAIGLAMLAAVAVGVRTGSRDRVVDPRTGGGPDLRPT